ncbi:MAG: UPF0182 family protein [Armatimonadota bacterium]|nr:UPF0182 family protein [bacterium]
MQKIRTFFWPVVIAVAVLLLIFSGALVAMYTDWLWFKNLGFGTVFSTIILTKLKLGLVLGLLFFAVIYGNLWYARRIAPPPSPMGLEAQLIERLGRLARRGIGVVIFGASVIVSFMVGLEAATHWEQWLKFANPVSFGTTDPVFARDISFYVFKLPFLSYIYSWLFFALAVSTIAAIAIHYADEAIETYAGRVQFAPGVKAHIGVLIALMFFLKAWGYRLAMYNVVLSRGSLFDGAGYADMHARVPVLWILLVIAIIGGVLVLLNISRRGITLAATGLIGLVAASILIGSIYPAMVQQFSVTPNEKDKERPYIKRAIAATQQAYGLSEVIAKPFSADTGLTPDQISANNATIENIRLWDKDHLQAAYNQIQTIQQYYHFSDVDVDRYWITDPQTGQKSYRQVWLSARELDQSRLPDRSQTWINQHLQYTHGYGLAMSPVNEVSQEGLPSFLVYDIPPKTTADIATSVPGVYFGEMTDNYVFNKTDAAEFDYPTGEGNKTTNYKGNNGVPVGGFFRKLLFAARMSDLNILLNQNIKSESRIMFRREVTDRIQTLLPFLQFDQDPYLVTAGGKLYWMRDGYTTTDAYPYSKHEGVWGNDINYIRNSVKVVVDAYTGHLDAYIIEKPLKDPIIRSYEKIFPGIFKNISSMPADLRDHTRYPEDLFRIQTMVYARWHYSKKDPDGFYTNSDFWRIPDRADLTGMDSEQANPMEPYYNIMKLPNGDSEEFILMTPYTRAGRKNMVSWICAKCDEPDYGRLVLYQFPENKNVYGPQQIAGRATQDTTISQQLSLWNQQGSKVGSGNLLVIPIESSLLYVMPVYLVSTSTQIPELKRVIVALGDKLSMQPTLEQALADVVGGQVSAPAVVGNATGPKGPARPKASGEVPSLEITRLVNKAASEYEKAEQAQKNGDWAAYGEHIKAMKQALNELKAKSQ